MARSPKVKSLDELARSIDEIRGGDSSPCVVHCHGVFDLLHIGHIRYLQKARQLGDLLIVTITPDEFVNKGPHRPAFQQELRLDALAALDCIDFVAINRWPTATEAIRLLKPDVYAKGAEFRDRKTPELLEEEAAADEVSASVEYIEAVTSSSSHLLNQHLSPFEDETDRYLQGFRERYTASDIHAWLEKTRDLKVLVVGEAIIDEYYACSALGQSERAPILSTRYESHDRYAGGAIAVANHLAPFCGQIHLLSMLGTENSEEEWLRAHLATGVAADFIHKQNSPTIIKRRYRERYFGTPLFAINFLSDEGLAEAEERQLCDWLSERIADYDVVIAADYGHQMLTQRAVELLCNGAKFLAINTQSNAANSGIHTISKYPRADYVLLAQRELELECRTRTGDLREQLTQVGQQLYASTVAVTRGKRGCLCYNRRAGFHDAPSLATQVVDRIGAGDAVLAITSICAAVDAPLDVLAFLGNVAGAEAVAVVGHSRTLEALPLRRHVESLFK